MHAVYPERRCLISRLALSASLSYNETTKRMTIAWSFEAFLRLICGRLSTTFPFPAPFVHRFVPFCPSVLTTSYQAVGLRPSQVYMSFNSTLKFITGNKYFRLELL